MPRHKIQRLSAEDRAAMETIFEHKQREFTSFAFMLQMGVGDTEDLQHANVGVAMVYARLILDEALAILDGERAEDDNIIHLGLHKLLDSEEEGAYVAALETYSEDEAETSIEDLIEWMMSEEEETEVPLDLDNCQVFNLDEEEDDANPF